MARKRKSTDMEPPAHVPRNANPKHLKEDLEDLCRKASIKIPYNETSPPAKSPPANASSEKSADDLGTYVFKQYHLLWWKDQAALESAISTFFQILPTLHVQTRSTRLELLRDILKGPTDAAKRMCATPRKIPKTSKEPDPTQPYSEPSSPTPAARTMKQHFTVSKPSTKSRSKAASSPIKPPPPLANAVTSFASTAASTSFADTSFAKSSFQSIESHFEAPDTAATSFSSDFQPLNRDSNYLSSLGSTGAAELQALMESAESSQELKVTKRAAQTAISGTLKDYFAAQESQSTIYSDIDQTAAEVICRKYDYTWSNHQRQVEKGVIQPTSSSETIASSGTATLTPPTEPGEDVEMGDAPHHHVKPEAEIEEPPSKPRNHRKAHWRVADITKHGLTQLNIPECFHKLAFSTRWEAHRLLQTGEIAAEDLKRRWSFPHSMASLYELATELEQENGFCFERSFRDADNTDPRGRTFSAKLKWALEGPNIFDLELQPLRKNITNVMQRKFGESRLLQVALPPLYNPEDESLKGQGYQIQSEFLQMLRSPQPLLGRRWQFFLVQPRKRKKSSDPDSIKAGMSTLFFFAVGGDLALPDCNLTDALNWALPFQENARQPACKAYARLDLSASRTYPTLVFDLTDVEYDVEDMLSTNVPDDRRFEDPRLSHRFKEEFNPRRRIVMSDGCSEISSWAMAQIAQILGLSEVPSVIQGRIFGAKGIWYISADQDTARTPDKPPGKHIRIANSQIKVRYPIDRVHQFGKELLTMNVVKASGPCRPSILHVGFMPLLEDRRVPASAICDFVGPQVQVEMDDLLVSLETPLQLREWMAQQNEYYEICNRENGITTVGGFPWSRGEQIIQMLESGFHPKEDAYLAELVIEMVGNYLMLKRKNFKIHVPRSTTVIGISDPLGCLQPGEIHIGFSSPFRDYKAGISWMHLHGMNVLCSRNPSMAGSDMQKLRAVYKPELAHLRDVVVFPSQGMRPLAGKLQGGDYDGDTFWLCWEPSLVVPFWNAPAPWQTDIPTPEQLGITKDTTTLGEKVGSFPTESALADWLVACAASRMSQTLLGTVTLEWEKLVYHDNDIGSQRSQRLITLHDYLVDADKQGYRFDKSAWDSFKLREKTPKNLRTPTYRSFTSYDEEDGEKASSMVKYKVPPRIIDTILFDVIMPIVTETKDKAFMVVKEHASPLDLHLVRFYRATLKSEEHNHIIRAELNALKDKLGSIRELFRRGTKRKDNWDVTVSRCRQAYDAISPSRTDSASVIEWLRAQDNDMTMWDKFKASALANFEYGGSTPGRFMYNVAGEELCRLKANAVGRTRVVIMPQYLILKPRKRKRVEIVEELDNEYDMNESLFDDLMT